ncbi:M15 family metallopeptidase [Calothrix sp. 336/3]|uniref:M15 family metallopeptidase n=1 Tax=Calothrix sp. 336/3 TaxID=1337936 RepID=UPI0004E2E516|nr:M15 family metallopeptidase [Calothrix sp. 336/3]AKG22028.1 D-alanyl-D-alanine carboxypeptidase [Calothrix sp. 336/3]
MNNPGFSDTPPNPNSTPSEDIPVAQRDLPDVTPKSSNRLPWLISGCLVLLGGIGGLVYFFTLPKKTVENSAPNIAATSTPTPTTNPDQVLGHLAYPEAPLEELEPVSVDGRILMRQAAAAKFQEMVVAARTQGINLVPISGFRSIEEQKQLFFQVAAQRNQTPAQRAALSAPPGHSEHHTGYAVDIADGSARATDLSPNFEKTKAFQWLQANAARYSFEMSFPKDNPQGVSYEPWHWRFVGDRQSLELFYKAKNLKPQP